MILFPLVAALISLSCALVVARDGWHRPKPDKIAWAIAFAIFAVAAGSEVAGAALGWTPALVRLYYLTGAVLVVGYLALGELYLLAPRRVATIGPGAALLITAFAATLVLGAPIDSARMADDGWEALGRGTALTSLTIALNAGGTFVLAGGALWSAWRFWRRRIFRHRMIGCLLIAAGTLIVASGGTLTRLGHREYLYIAMSAGVAVIFAGYLQARRPEPSLAAAVAAQPDEAPRDGKMALVPLPSPRLRRDPALPADPAIIFLEELLPREASALRQTLRVWSVEPVVADHFTRAEAIRVWALRLRLSADGRRAFDAHAVPEQVQLAELYHEVLAPGVVAFEAEGQARGRVG